MPGIRRFAKSISKLYIAKEDTKVEFPGLLGMAFKGQQYVDVPNRDGYVYVRLRSNQNEVIQAYNSSVSPVYDLPVMVARDESFERFIIRGRDLGRYGNWGTSPYLPRHGAQHSFSDYHYGGDIVWVYDRQFVPLSISPSGTYGAGNVFVNGDAVYWNGDWIYAGNTGSPDLLAYKPTGSNARMVLIYINEYGNPAVLAGDYVNNLSLTGMNQLIDYLPSLSTSLGIPIGAVRLLSGTTAIGWGSIYDLRPLLSQATWTTPYQVEDEGTPLSRRKYLNFKGSTVWAVDNSGDDSTDIIISGSAGAGHTIQDEGTPLSQRTNLNVEGHIIWATDDAGNNASVISVTGTHVIQSSTQPSGTFPGMLWLKPT